MYQLFENISSAIVGLMCIYKTWFICFVHVASLRSQHLWSCKLKQQRISQKCWFNKQIPFDWLVGLSDLSVLKSLPFTPFQLSCLCQVILKLGVQHRLSPLKRAIQEMLITNTYKLLVGTVIVIHFCSMYSCCSCVEVAVFCRWNVIVYTCRLSFGNLSAIYM